MKFLTPFLTIALLSSLGIPNIQAQSGVDGFEGLFETAAIGGGGTTSTEQSQTEDRDGGGSIDAIKANWPNSGKMTIRKTHLTWDEGVKPTKITLKKRSELIFTAPVTGNSISVDFSKLGLDTISSYNLQLTTDTLKSRRTAIKFVSQAKLDEALSDLEANLSYKQSDGIKKKLMKAYFLENNGFNYEAYEAYHISTSNPRDMEVILHFFNRFRRMN